MSKPIIECVPNFSEGRRPEIVTQIVDVVREAKAEGLAVSLLDYSSDADHNRSVVTYIGEPEAVAEVAVRLAAKAAELIDMEQHSGAHPRIGATDVIPFIPVSGITMPECVAISQRVGERLATEIGIPVYLYAESATSPARKRLPDVRSGQYEGLKAAISTPERKPDFGGAQLHPTAGATAVGARSFLIAYNINLNTPNVEIAKKIGKNIRESSGGLVNVQAMGVDLAAQGLAQVSMNLLNHKATPIYRAFELVRAEAARYGVTIAHSELVGLLPLDAMIDAAAYYLQLEGFSRDQILEVKMIGGD